MANAARIGDAHTCPLATPAAHVGGVIVADGSGGVSIEYLPAATVGSTCACGPGPVNKIVAGSGTVLIDSKPAARVGDSTSHGGTIVMGAGTVVIG